MLSSISDGFDEGTRKNDGCRAAPIRPKYIAHDGFMPNGVSRISALVRKAID